MKTCKNTESSKIIIIHLLVGGDGFVEARIKLTEGVGVAETGLFVSSL